MAREYSYYVSPRYTAGSPDKVSYEVAHRVAQEELQAFQHHLDGYHGPEAQKVAEKLRLKGIVEQRKIFGRYYIAYDMLTFETRDSRKKK